MNVPINNFTVLESIYGRFIVNRHCQFQAEHLVKSGIPHIQPELQVILGIIRTLPPDCVVVDAGANIGLVAVPIAQEIKAKHGIVHAFEVQRMMFYALCGTVALNDLETLFVHHKGLGAMPETLKVPQLNYSVVQDFGLLTLLEQEKIKEHDEISIVAVDGLNLPRLDFLKIDVEGMEIDVLRGSRRMIEAFHPWCWVEYWKSDIPSIKKQFEGLDYKFYKIDELNMLCAPIGRVKAAEIAIAAPEM